MKGAEMAEESKPKIGAGTLGAWFRLGLRELRGALYPESNIAQQTEYGMFGSLTPGEVAAARRDDPDVQRLDQEPVQARQANGANPQRLLSPSEIVQASKPQASVHGTASQAEDRNVQSPSEIAQDRQPYVPAQDRHGDSHRHGMRM
jgi:hypothetical protein